MSTASLNLIAIAIFTTTLLSVLGPLFNISPLVPVSFVLGLLGLFTVDNLAWNGQGGLLFQDWLARRSPEYCDRVAYHEAGHFLVAHLLDIPVTGYSLSAWEALQQGQQAQGGVRFDDQKLEQQLADGFLTQAMADRYLQVWMAGGAAEKLVFQDVQGAAEDVSKVRLLLKHLNYPSTQWEQKERWAALQAEQLLKRHRPDYERLVEHLKQGVPLEICQAALPSPV